MAFKHDQIIQAQFEGLNSERARALADYESGRIREDEDACMGAADRILFLDQRLAALGNIANNLVHAQQQPQGNKYGLSHDEIEVAHGIAGNDPNMSRDQREQVYAQNKSKLAHMRASGAYRDDQGRR